MCAENTDHFTTDIRIFKRCFNFRRTASPTNEYSVTGVENLHVLRVFRREDKRGVVMPFLPFPALPALIYYFTVL